MTYIDPALFLSFVITSFAIELTPGPNMAYLALISASEGRKYGFAAMAGVALGLTILGLVAACGLADLIANTPPVYQILRWSGVLYLLWLAWDAWMDKSALNPTNTHEHIKLGRFFKRGLITNLLNPKAATFYVAVMPVFYTGQIDLTIQALILTLTYVMIATVIHTAIVLLAGNMKTFFENEKWMMTFRRTLSIVLAAIALWFAWSTRI